MKKKLVIINSLFYDNLIFEKYKFDKYLDNELIEVEFWSLSFIDQEELKKNNIELFNAKNKEENELIQSKLNINFKKIYKFNEFILNLKQLKKNTFIFDLTLASTRNPIYCFLYKFFGAKLVYHGLTTDVSLVNFNFKDLFFLLKKNIYEWPLLIKKGFIFMFKNIYKKLLKPKIDIFFYNGTNEKDFAKKISKKIVSLHASDYEKYYEEEKIKDRFISQKFVLFLDMGYPKPEDINFTSERPATNEYDYKKGMKNLFNNIVKLFPDQKIVVALHPKSKKENFYGYESYKNLTPKLTKECSFVLSHNSISLQFAALWNKPSFLIYNNDMIKKFNTSKEIEWFINEYKLPKINIDNLNAENLKNLILDQKKKFDNGNKYYKDFIKRFIKDEPENEKRIPKTIIETISNF